MQMISMLPGARGGMRRRFMFAVVAVATASVSTAQAGQPDEGFLQPQNYPAHIAAVNFDNGRMTARDPVVIDGWEVRVRPEVIVTWREIFGADALKPRRGIHISAFCNRPSSSQREACTLVVADRDGGSEVFPRCALEILRGEDQRFHRSRSECPKSVEFGEPVAR